MKHSRHAIGLLCLVFSISWQQCEAQAQSAASEKKQADAKAADAAPKDAQPKTDDNIWTRTKLTGDWGGARTDLANHGITIDLRLTQYYQGVANGGVNTNFSYGGKLDVFLNMDGKKLGLWEGLMINVHAESQFGNSVLSDAGAFALANTTMLYPTPSDTYRNMAVTQVLFMQFLSKELALVVGKVNAIDFWTMIYPETGGGVDGFLNVNMLTAAMPWFRWVNLSMWAAGPVVFTDDGKVKGALVVLDLNNAPTTTGIPKMFNDGAGVLGLWKFFFDVNDKPGDIMLAAGGSTREYFSFEKSATGWGEMGGGITGLIQGFNSIQGILDDNGDGVWSAGIYYNQVLWEEPTNDKQNLRFFTGWSVSDGDPSFSKWAGLASLEATGLLFDREKDRVGVGGFYAGLSKDFKRTLNNVGVDLRDTWGIELYYNAEITPWFHLTTDVQYVQNQNDGDDPAIILGLRGVIEF